MGVVPARADRGIVFAARYYAPPGSHAVSHFHLYRINPDGTGRRQLTFSVADDEDPAWSPDGNWVIFTRGGHSLCVVRADGGRVRTLLAYPPEDSATWGPARWLPDGTMVAVAHTRWGKTQTASAVYLIDVRTRRKSRIADASDFVASPDGRYAALVGSEAVRILDRRTGVQTRIPGPLEDAVWLNNQALIGSVPQASGKLLRVVGRGGQERRRMPIPIPLKLPGSDEDLTGRAATLLPGRNQSVVYAVNNHNSTVGADFYFFRVSLTDQAATYLAEGQFLSWSSAGTRFCTAPGRDLAAYGKTRQVWVAPLQVGMPAKPGLKTITPGLVWVTGADWRPGDAR